MGGEGGDTLWGGTGDDFVFGEKNGSSLYNGPGGDDTLFGNDGNDTLKGEDGNDVLWGGADTDAMYGGIGNDSFGNVGGVSVADAMTDNMYGDAGDDIMYVSQGGFGHDYFYGGTDYDILDRSALNPALVMSWTYDKAAGSGQLMLTDGSILDFYGIEAVLL